MIARKRIYMLVLCMVLLLFGLIHLVGFATSFDVDMDAFDPDAAASGVFIVIAKPNVTDD